MKGGKRLSEEERVDIGKLVLWAQGRLYLAREGTKMARDSALDETERTLKKIASYFERDDEPEYCTCVDKGERISRRVMAGGAVCLNCGKPVKGE